jgi:hypothetical protein
MFVIHRTGKISRFFGDTTQGYCPTCRSRQTLQRRVSYDYLEIFFIKIAARKRVYTLACTVCGQGAILDTKIALADVGVKYPIPFFTHFGVPIILGAGIVFVAVADQRERYEKSSNLAYVRSPQKNDIFIIDIAPLLQQPIQPFMFSALRVADMRGTDVIFQVSKHYAYAAGEIAKDVNQGKLENDNYFRSGQLVIAVSQLELLNQDYKIDRVERETDPLNWIKKLPF